MEQKKKWTYTHKSQHPKKDHCHTRPFFDNFTIPSIKNIIPSIYTFSKYNKFNVQWMISSNTHLHPVPTHFSKFSSKQKMPTNKYLFFFLMFLSLHHFHLQKNHTLHLSLQKSNWKNKKYHSILSGLNNNYDYTLCKKKPKTYIHFIPLLHLSFLSFSSFIFPFENNFFICKIQNKINK
jgi:hypothetical protein